MKFAITKAQLEEKMMCRDKDQVCGFHGTSIETLEHALQTGRLPSSRPSTDQETQHQGGRLFFYPTCKTVSEYPFASLMQESLEDAAVASIYYANIIGYTHGVLRDLGLPIDNRKFTEICPPTFSAEELTRRETTPTTKPSRSINSVDDFIDEIRTRNPHWLQIIRRRKKTKENIVKAICANSSRQGVRLGIAHTAKKFQIIEGDESERDAAILCGDGLKLEHICSIELLGDYERSRIETILSSF